MSQGDRDALERIVVGQTYADVSHVVEWNNQFLDEKVTLFAVQVRSVDGVNGSEAIEAIEQKKRKYWMVMGSGHSLKNYLFLVFPGNPDDGMVLNTAVVGMAIWGDV